MTTISTALTSLKTATDIARFLKDSDLSLEKAETKLKLAEIVSSLADAKMEIAHIQEEILEKDRRIKHLEEALEVKEQMVWRDFVYYRIVEGGKEEGPFCPQYYDNDNKLIRLQTFGSGFCRCMTCKQDFLSQNYNPERQDITYDDFDPSDY